MLMGRLDASPRGDGVSDVPFSLPHRVWDFYHKKNEKIRMRKVIITRQRSLAGIMIPYHCIIGSKDGVFGKASARYLIKNGETVTIDLPETELSVIAGAHTSGGDVFSNPLKLPAGKGHIELSIVTRYSLKKGSSIELISVYGAVEF